MVDLPQRFVPTASKLIRHANAVLQCGHNAPVACVKFSPNSAYIASADAGGTLLIWAFDTLDVLGAYRLDFLCTRIEWRRSGKLACLGSGGAERIIDLDAGDGSIFPEDAAEPDASRIIRFIGTPEIEVLPDACEIRYGDDVFPHEVKGLKRAQIEPCERYAVAVSPSELRILPISGDGDLLRIEAPQNTAWIDFVISKRGDFVVALLDDSTFYHIDPAKLRAETVALRHGRITAADLTDDAFIAYGNEAGNVGVYQVSRRASCLRTARKPHDFAAAYPSPESSGFIGLRPESATAFLGNSNEILPSDPLPAPVTASCAGSASSEFIAACADGHIYQIRLGSGTIRRRADAVNDVAAICACGDACAFCDVSGNLFVFSGSGPIASAAQAIAIPKKIAAAENGSAVACLYDGEIVVHSVKKTSSKPQHFAVSHCADIAFCREKTAQNLILIEDGLSVSILSLKDGSVSDLCRIDIACGRYISYAYARKSAIFALCEGEPGHKIVVEINLKTGKASEVLRILSCGRQIWAAAVSPEILLLRNDVSPVKIVSAFKAFSLEDWTRSEPLGNDQSAAY